MADALWKLSAVELAKGIRARTFGCADVMASVVERVRERNPDLNAIVYDYSHDAMRQAELADKAVKNEEALGPLHGIPVTIKENIDVKGTPTPNGVAAFEEIIAPDNSPVVRNLTNAGAIVIGRTNTPEFSMRLTTDNLLHGRTKSPWSERASPGGSSGGGGAAAAAGFGPIHHGNDIGGSLRFPAFCCGLATIKPGLGRVPAYNPSATVERGLLAQIMSVQGAMCREVCDVRLATMVMAGGDARDPWWAPVPFDGPALAQPIKVAFTRETCGYDIHPEIVAGLERAAKALHEAGYAVEEPATPSIADVAQEWFEVAVFELNRLLGPGIREHGSETIQRMFNNFERMGETLDADGYLERIAARTALVRDWTVFTERYPLVLTPFLMRPTYDWDEDQRSFESAQDIFQASVYSMGLNYLGLPAGVVPIGLIEGRPAGVQIVGRKFREDLVLDAMEAIERDVGVLTHRLWETEVS